MVKIVKMKIVYIVKMVYGAGWSACWLPLVEIMEILKILKLVDDAGWREGCVSLVKIMKNLCTAICSMGFTA